MTELEGKGKSLEYRLSDDYYHAVGRKDSPSRIPLKMKIKISIKVIDYKSGITKVLSVRVYRAVCSPEPGGL